MHPPRGAAVAGVFCQLNTKQGDKMNAIVICHPLVYLSSCIDLEWAFLIVLFHTPEESRAHRGLRGLNVLFCWRVQCRLWVRFALICPSICRQWDGEQKWVWVYLPEQGAIPPGHTTTPHSLLLPHNNGIQVLTSIHLWWIPCTS